MKKYYNATLSILLSFLLSFNLYGQIVGEPATPINLCLNADINLIIEDVVWNADQSDLLPFYEDHGYARLQDTSTISLYGIPIPESFHMVELGHSIPKSPSWGSYIFDVSVAPTTKPVVFVYVQDDDSRWTPIIDQNGYIVGMRIDNKSGVGVASTIPIVGAQGDDSDNIDWCIDIITTNRVSDIGYGTCDLADADYRSCRTLEPLNKEAQDIASYLINFYPNPTKNDLFVEANDIDIQKIELLTLQGQVQSQVSIRYGIDKIEIGTSSLPSGIYLLRLEAATETIVEKIIIQ